MGFQDIANSVSDLFTGRGAEEAAPCPHCGKDTKSAPGAHHLLDNADPDKAAAVAKAFK